MPVRDSSPAIIASDIFAESREKANGLNRGPRETYPGIRGILRYFSSC